MSLLALHTTDARASVVVDRGDRVVGREFQAMGAHAPSVLAEIQCALVDAEVGLGELDALAITVGPGSFTGIRVGIATVQGLAAARGLPIWTTGSLNAHAAAFHGVTSHPLAIVLDARRGEVFAGLYDVTTDVPRLVLAPFCGAPAAAAVALAAAGAAAITGSGASLVDLPGMVRLDAAPISIAAALAQLVRAGACRQSAARHLEPEYLRKSDAELQRDGQRAQ